MTTRKRTGHVLPGENELKISLLDQRDYELLLTELGEPKSHIRQVNHYYDTADRALWRRRMCFRLREQEGRFIVALKRGRRWNDGYLVADELEAELPESIPDPRVFDPYRWDALPVQFLQKELGSPGLVWLGSIRNTRRVYALPHGMRLEVDATEFPGGAVEYELEAEWPEEEEIRATVVGLLDAWGVRWKPQTRTKYQRFLEYLGPNEGGAE